MSCLIVLKVICIIITNSAINIFHIAAVKLFRKERPLTQMYFLLSTFPILHHKEAQTRRQQIPYTYGMHTVSVACKSIFRHP